MIGVLIVMNVVPINPVIWFLRINQNVFLAQFQIVRTKRDLDVINVDLAIQSLQIGNPAILLQ